MPKQRRSSNLASLSPMRVYISSTVATGWRCMSGGNESRARGGELGLGMGLATELEKGCSQSGGRRTV
eukprot:828768-Rhodomonas_salina.1